MPDEAIRRRLAVEADLLFLTQDTEFAELPADTAATVLISRIRYPQPSSWRPDGPMTSNAWQKTVVDDRRRG